MNYGLARPVHPLPAKVGRLEKFFVLPKALAEERVSDKECLLCPVQLLKEELRGERGANCYVSIFVVP